MHQVGPYRVWLKHENIPGLAMSRAYGDAVAHTVGVTCDPGEYIITNKLNGIFRDHREEFD